jgi:hypothetical protein
MLNARDFEDAKKWNTLHKLYNDPRLKLSDRRVGHSICCCRLTARARTCL